MKVSANNAMTTMKTIISILALTLLLVLVGTAGLHVSAKLRAPALSAPQSDYSQLKADAETAYAQGSYSRANEIYARVDKTKVSPAEARWVDFRLADTLWRAQAPTGTADTT